MPQILKKCPVCTWATGEQSIECPRCAYNYRTGFDPNSAAVRNPQPVATPGHQQYTTAEWIGGLTVIIIVFLLMCLGIFTSRTGEDVAKVKFGMTTAQVRDVMGEPSQTQDLQSPGMRMQMWYYQVGNKQVQISFQNGYVVSVNRY